MHDRANMMIQDVPSPINLRLMPDARQWAATAMEKRPWRTEFFALFALQIQTTSGPVGRVLELGSGPGFLAEYLLTELPDITYVALDFSPAMHELAAERLGSMASRVHFVERSFREPDWAAGLGSFTSVVTNQAVHELRHQHYARGLHAEARKLLAPGGSYFVCDHHTGEGGMKNTDLYMSVAEQRNALLDAGFDEVEQLLHKRGLVLHRASLS